MSAENHNVAAGTPVPAQVSCESCGMPAERRSTDGSTWCQACNDAAIHLGYDNDEGEPMVLIDIAEQRAVDLLRRAAGVVRG